MNTHQSPVLLKQEQIESFQHDGYLLLRGFYDLRTVRLEVPVGAPDEPPPGTDHVYIGLNPVPPSAELELIRSRLPGLSEVFSFQP